MSSADCRDVNWYDVGYRDARFRLQSQADVYAQQCERQGVKVDAVRYEEGLRQGRYRAAILAYSSADAPR